MAKVRKRGKGWQIDYFDPLGKRIRTTFKKKKDAVEELAKRVSLIAEGRYLDVKKDCKTTLNELTSKYSENYPHSAKKHYCDNFHAFFGKNTLLVKIRYVGLETYRNHLRRKLTKNGTVRKDSTVNREMSCLHHIFIKAVEWEMIEQSPFDKGKSLRLKENNKRLRYLTEDEIPRLLDECPGYLSNIVECAINTGMRLSEILGLKWDHVRNGYIYLRETKTKEPRQIPINNDLETVFKRIRKAQHLTSKHVFLYERKPLKGVKRSFKTALKKAGIQDFKFHDLRHTFASQLIMKGGTLKDVQELLGHKSMTMTLRYAHLTQEHKRKAVNLLNGLTASKNEKEICHKTVTSLKSPVSASL